MRTAPPTEVDGAGLRGSLFGMDVTEMPDLAVSEAAFMLSKASAALLGGTTQANVNEAATCTEGALMILRTLSEKL